jgi:exopolyphosphatase/guanosine-5'-triphosphate,3'-diphosphate pyrophosphatase
VLDLYRRLIDQHGVLDGVAAMTSAVRDATNGEEFASTVQRRWGLKPRVLSGDEEARLTFLGATSERDPSDGTPTLVIDIGGGSTEFVIGTGGEMQFHVSNQAGVVRQTERHVHSDPTAPDELEALTHDVRKILRTGVPQEWRRAVQHAIGVAGTATSMASIAQELEPYDPDRVEGYVLGVAECREIYDRLAKMTVAERRQVRGLHPDRAPAIVAGVIILLETLALFDLDEVEVSEHDILHGAAIALG